MNRVLLAIILFVLLLVAPVMFVFAVASVWAIMLPDTYYPELIVCGVIADVLSGAMHVFGLPVTGVYTVIAILWYVVLGFIKARTTV